MTTYFRFVDPLSSRTSQDNFRTEMAVGDATCRASHGMYNERLSLQMEHTELTQIIGRLMQLLLDKNLATPEQIAEVLGVGYEVAG